MKKSNFNIRTFESSDTDEVIFIWEQCGLIRSWNNPKLDIQRKKIFIKGYNSGIRSNNDEKKRMIVKYNVLFSRLSDYYFYTNHREETVDLSIKTIVDQIFGHLYVE